MTDHSLWAVIRFQVPDPLDFAVDAQEVVSFWRNAPGCRSCQLVRNVDEPELWLLISHWDDVGAYRRSFSGTEAKMLLTPLLGRALDEPSAYLAPEHVLDGFQRVREGTSAR